MAHFTLPPSFLPLLLASLLLLLVPHSVCAITDVKTQRRAITFVAENLPILLHAGVPAALSLLCTLAGKKYNKDRTTVLRWYKEYDNYGEYPDVVKKRWKRLLRRAGTGWKTTARWRPREYAALKKILDEHPEYYLDEFVEQLFFRTGSLFHPTTVSRVLRRRFNYSLKSFSTIAAERNEVKRERYRQRLRGLVRHPNQVVFIDETAKDRNASRRRRAWGPRGQRRQQIRLFGGEVRYTCIAAYNLLGFMVPACDIVLRESTDGSSGTVDSDRFVQWVKEKLAPQLGDYIKGEPNSIVVMDNVIMHLDPRVEEIIKATGAWLVLLSPYSPDLNPIEMGFSQYKAYLRRHAIHTNRGEWEALHIRALNSVLPTVAQNHFRHCGVPGMEQIPLESDESEIIEMMMALLLLDEEDEE